MKRARRTATGAERHRGARSDDVSRETSELVRRYELPTGAATTLTELLSALEREPAAPTSVSATDASEIHVADSLSGLEVAVLRRAGAIVDIGAGAGFPGLVLAAAVPQARVDLVESSARKASVIGRLATAARLVNARPVAARAEEWAAGEGSCAYDVVTARALAPLAVLVEYAAPLLRPGGVLVAWKGRRNPDEEGAAERAAPEVGMQLAEVLPVRPFAASQHRYLYVYSKVTPTPPRFPRRAGVAAKRPLAG